MKLARYGDSKQLVQPMQIRREDILLGSEGRATASKINFGYDSRDIIIIRKGMYSPQR